MLLLNLLFELLLKLIHIKPTLSLLLHFLLDPLDSLCHFGIYLLYLLHLAIIFLLIPLLFIPDVLINTLPIVSNNFRKLEHLPLLLLDLRYFVLLHSHLLVAVFLVLGTKGVVLLDHGGERRHLLQVVLAIE